MGSLPPRNARPLGTALRQFFLIGPGELSEFVSSRRHTLLFSRYRSRFILSRVRMMAAVFAVLTPLWSIIDFAAFPTHLAISLAGGRLIISLAFVLLASVCRCTPSPEHARYAIGLTLTIPTVFFLYSRMLLAGSHLNELGMALSAGYTFLPFVLLTGLALFPLVALETLLFSTPLLVIFFISSRIHGSGLLPGFDDLAVFWLLLLITAVVSMASMSQLQLMKNLFQQSSLDHLTQMLNRRSGEQFLQLQMAQAKRHAFPISVALLDLDDFKLVNDRYGHEVGDKILMNMANKVKASMRDSDALIRWGGEEFLIVLPFATLEQAARRLKKIVADCQVQRPDGSLVTCSVGIAQWPRDASANSWQELLTLADARMYRAKSLGKAQMVTE